MSGIIFVISCLLVILAGCQSAQIVTTTSSHATKTTKREPKKKSVEKRQPKKQVSSKAASTQQASESSTTEVTSNAGDEAQNIRVQVAQVVDEDGNTYSLDELDKIADSDILSAVQYVSEYGGDISAIAGYLAKTYPAIVIAGSSNSNGSANNTSQTSSVDRDHESAEQIRAIMVSNQGFNKTVLDSIPDETILEASPTIATNSGVAETAVNLLNQYPALKE